MFTNPTQELSRMTLQSHSAKEALSYVLSYVRLPLVWDRLSWRIPDRTLGLICRHWILRTKTWSCRTRWKTSLCTSIVGKADLNARATPDDTMLNFSKNMTECRRAVLFKDFDNYCVNPILTSSVMSLYARLFVNAVIVHARTFHVIIKRSLLSLMIFLKFQTCHCWRYHHTCQIKRYTNHKFLWKCYTHTCTHVPAKGIKWTNFSTWTWIVSVCQGCEVTSAMYTVETRIQGLL